MARMFAASSRIPLTNSSYGRPAAATTRPFHLLMHALLQRRHRFQIAAEIRGEHFHSRVGQREANLSHRLGEMVRPAVAEVVAIDRGDRVPSTVDDVSAMVFLGGTMLTVVLVRVIRGHFTAEHHFAFEGAAWYWHFVDVVWLGLYVVVYWL